jgi:hypothetical protein
MLSMGREWGEAAAWAEGRNLGAVAVDGADQGAREHGKAVSTTAPDYAGEHVHGNLYQDHGLSRR